MKHIPEHIQHIQGGMPGPVVSVLGGTHGDERIGIDVIQKICTALHVAQTRHGVTHFHPDVMGEVYVGLGNPKAIEKGTRAAEEGPDLNRSFLRYALDAEPKADDRYDLTRARELLPIFARTDYLFDLHCTTEPSVPFVCFGDDTPAHREVYRHIPVKHVLTDPDRILPADVGTSELGTTDHAVDLYGGSTFSIQKYGSKKGVGLCYETGQKDDVGKADTVFGVVMDLLHAVGTFAQKDVSALRQYTGQKVYRLTHMIPAKEKEFVFEPRVAFGFAPVNRYDRLGHYVSSKTPEYACDDGFVLFQKSTQTGSSHALCYLAQEL